MRRRILRHADLHLVDGFVVCPAFGRRARLMHVEHVDAGLVERPSAPGHGFLGPVGERLVRFLRPRPAGLGLACGGFHARVRRDVACLHSVAGRLVAGLKREREPAGRGRAFDLFGQIQGGDGGFFGWDRYAGFRRVRRHGLPAQGFGTLVEERGGRVGVHGGETAAMDAALRRRCARVGRRGAGWIVARGQILAMSGHPVVGARLIHALAACQPSLPRNQQGILDRLAQPLQTSQILGFHARGDRVPGPDDSKLAGHVLAMGEHILVRHAAARGLQNLHLAEGRGIEQPGRVLPIVREREPGRRVRQAGGDLPVDQGAHFLASQPSVAGGSRSPLAARVLQPGFVRAGAERLELALRAGRERPVVPAHARRVRERFARRILGRDLEAERELLVGGQRSAFPRGRDRVPRVGELELVGNVLGAVHDFVARDRVRLPVRVDHVLERESVAAFPGARLNGGGVAHLVAVNALADGFGGRGGRHVRGAGRVVGHVRAGKHGLPR